MGSSRVIVVVPRHERGLHDYLQRSMACLKDVEVVLDRRATSIPPADERRRPLVERKLLLCSLVHCPASAPAGEEPPPSPPDDAHHRTLLWPRLRLKDL